MTKARDLADGVINTSELADGSITTAKIADGDITDAKLATGISSSKLTGALPAISGAALTGISAGLSGPRAEVFTSSGTFTVPAGVTAVKVTVVGGGGGSGALTGANVATAGGGAGGTAIEWITGLTSGSTVSVTIGAGGTGGTGTTNATWDGSDGGTSSFGAYCSASGGEGSLGSNQSNQAWGGAQIGSFPYGGVGSGGTLNIYGGSGGQPHHDTTLADAMAGSGGAPMGVNGLHIQAQSSSYTDSNLLYANYYPHMTRIGGFFGGYAGGIMTKFGGDGDDATGYGCGGGGSAANSGTDRVGGDGYQGIVIVEY